MSKTTKKDTMEIRQLWRKIHSNNFVPDERDRRIVAAAKCVYCREKDDSDPTKIVIAVGARHGDLLIRAQLEAAGHNWKDVEWQGFICNFGDFWNRFEAWDIAERAGQIKTDTPHYESEASRRELTSESVW